MFEFRFCILDQSLVKKFALAVGLIFFVGFSHVHAQANPRGTFEFVARAGTADDGAQDMILDGSLLYVANKFSGLQIIDVSDFSNPIVKSRTKSDGQNYGLTKKNNFVFMADNIAGFLVYDVTNPSKPKKITELSVKGETWDVKVQGNYAYVAAGLAGLVVIDITDPKAPKAIATLRYDKDWGYARKIFIGQNNLLYLADRKAGIHIINIENPLAPKEIKHYQTQYAEGIEVSEGYAYVADGPNGLVILDVSNPEKVRQVGEFHVPGYANGLVKSGPYLYLAVDDAGIRAIDVSNPSKPVFDARYDTPGQAFGIIKSDIFILVADLSSVIIMTHNKPPVIYKIDDKTVAENQKIQFKVRGYDPDGNPVGFSADFIPEGATFNQADTTFSWTPTFEQSGKYDGIVLSATEKTQTKLFSRDTISITVTNTNRPPSLPGTGNYSIDENKELSFTINKPADPDVEDTNKLKVSLTNPPQGGAFDENTLTFKWLPTYEQSGSYTLTFVVKDAAGASDSKQTVITVNNIDRPPVFSDIAPDMTVDENKILTFKIQAADPDKEDAGKLEYAGFNLPPGAAFDKISQTFSWTPTYDQSGKYDGIYFIVRDVEGLSDTVKTSVTVNHVNRPPFFAAIVPQQIEEVKVLTFKITAGDADVEDDGRLKIAATNLPQGATYQDATQTFSWAPTYDQSGDYTPSFKVTDGAGASDEMTIPIKVININRAPTIAAILAQSADENKDFTLVVPEGQDLDKEDIGKLTYTVENLPQGATFDAATRTIHWLPTYDQAGVYDGIKVTVKDVLGLTASTTFKITVKNVNRPPVIDALADQTVDETKFLQFRVKGSDPDKEDADKLFITASNLPPGAVVEDQGSLLFTWTPTFEQAGIYKVKFTITDPGKLTGTKEVTITVNNVNRLPSLAAIPALTGDEGKPLTVVVPAATDPDKEDVGKLVYSVEGLPEGAKFDAASRTISWTPTNDQAGNYIVKVTVKDVMGGADVKNLEIRVNNVNRPPVMGDIAAQTVNEGDKLTFTVDASDPDKEDANRLNVTADPLPQGATFNASSKTFSWTPTFEQAGNYTVTFKVSDLGGLTASKTVTITVKNVNRKPALANIPDQKVAENSPITFTVSANDPDKEDAGKVSLSADGLPNGASFSGGKFSWTPNYDQAGDYKVTFKAKDGQGLEDSKTVTITVTNVNRAPKLNSVSNQSATEGKELSFKVSATDEDKQDQLTFSMSGAPAGASLSSDGNFTWTPQVGQAGTYTITIKVSDGTAADTKSLSITVGK
jgi:hypothetical protein